jgi:hypothetical protein
MTTKGLFDSEARELAALVATAKPEYAALRRERAVRLLHKNDWHMAIDAAQEALLATRRIDHVMSIDDLEAALTNAIDGVSVWIKPELAKVREYFVMAERAAWPVSDIFRALARLRANPDSDPQQDYAPIAILSARRVGPLEASFLARDKRFLGDMGISEVGK